MVPVDSSARRLGIDFDIHRHQPSTQLAHRPAGGLPRAVAAAVLAVGILAGAIVAGFGFPTVQPPAGAATSRRTSPGAFTVGARISRRTAAAVDPAALPPLATLEPKQSCASLESTDFTHLRGAPTTITSVSIASGTTASGATFPYCDVHGTVAVDVEFELQLPTRTYAQRYLQEGCSGYCGIVGVSQPPASGQAGIDECVPLNDGLFALGQDDEGHLGNDMSAPWATTGDPMAKVEFGYLSEHAFAVAAKAIIASFYGRAPRYSYYDGCSDGGREALMEAQRYPHDFQGIIAGAPAFNQAALNAMEEPYEAVADETPSGQAILTGASAAILHTAVITQCADVSLRDGTIQDPYDCHLDYAAFTCPAHVGDTSGCLTPAQVAAAKRLYAGAVTPKGVHLYTGGEPYGSESAWSSIVIPARNTAPAGETPEDTTFFHGLGLAWWRAVGLWKDEPNAGPTGLASFTLKAFRTYVSTKNRANVAAVVDATDPNLTAFYRAGGKLITWQGWADQFIPPSGSVAYRQAVIDTMGAATVEKFYRLYMFPGVYHCGGGYGPDVFDLLTPLIDWVEAHRAPSDVVAAEVSGGTGPPGTGPSTGTVELTRPVYPYPEMVRYSGSGNPDDASSFVGYMPHRLHDDDIGWAGYPFTSGYEEWCTPRGSAPDCSRHPQPSSLAALGTSSASLALLAGGVAAALALGGASALVVRRRRRPGT